MKDLGISALPMAAVIVAYGQMQDARTLASQLADAAVRTVVVETGGGTIAAQSDPYVVKSVPNVGYGSAINLGVAELLSNPQDGLPRLLLVLNADCTIDESSILELQRAAVSVPEGVGAYAVRQTGSHGEDSDWTRVFPTPRMYLTTALRGRRAARSFDARERYPSGAVIAVATDAFLDLGGFDPAFFLYFEETDFYLRLANAGYETRVLEGAHVAHAGAGSTARYPGWTAFEYGRSAAIYGRKHATSYPAFAATFIAYLVSLATAKTLTRRIGDARSAMTHLAGFAVCSLLPTYEPLVHAPLKAEPIEQRRTARQALVRAAAAVDR